ncbi:hypothetical protein LINPERPRIM_LOCUS37469 [Linum perenne]
MTQGSRLSLSDVALTLICFPQTVSSLCRCTLDSTRATCHLGELCGLASVVMRPGRIRRMCLDPRPLILSFHTFLRYTTLSYAYVMVSHILCICPCSVTFSVPYDVSMTKYMKCLLNCMEEVKRLWYRWSM